MQQTHPKIFGLRRSALIETLLMLVILVVMDYVFFGGTRFFDVNPHPFWIVVLLIAAQYGTGEALMAAVIATLFYLVGNVPVIPNGTGRYDFLYQIAINPLLWFMVGWGIGELRQRHIRERDRLMTELEDSTRREQLIADSYQTVRTRKESLEIQVAGQLTSSIAAYRAAKAVETLDPKAVMQGIERLVSAVLAPQKFSLYLLHDQRLTATIQHGWAAGDVYMREFDSFHPLYQSIFGTRDVLVIANEQHEKILGDQGMLAAPVFDPATGAVVGMLKVEQMEFLSLSLNTVETFRALAEWIGTALINARNYQTVRSEAMVNPEHNLLSYGYFKRQSDYLARLGKRVGFDVSLLVISLTDAERLEEQERITIIRQISEVVRKTLRMVDLAFDYQTNGQEYSILLPATKPAGAQIVRDKIARELDRQIAAGRNVKFTYIVQGLYETA
jgi:GAF domain-containing protein